MQENAKPKRKHWALGIFPCAARVLAKLLREAGYQEVSLKRCTDTVGHVVKFYAGEDSAAKDEVHGLISQAINSVLKSKDPAVQAQYLKEWRAHANRADRESDAQEAADKEARLRWQQRCKVPATAKGK